MSRSVELTAALDAIDRVGGRLSVVEGRLRVDVDQELSAVVWATIKAHRDELVADFAGDSVIWTDDSPIWTDRAGPRVIVLPAGVDACDRCGGIETVDQEIHSGRSVRRDCFACGRFRKFTLWHGVPMP